MFCKNCGAELPENASVCLKCGVIAGDGNTFCPNCGAKPDPLATICVKCGYSLKQINPKSKTQRSKQLLQNKNVYNFKEAIVACYSKYATFEGRACRAEYWYWGLFGGLSYLLYIFLMIWVNASANRDLSLLLFQYLNVDCYYYITLSHIEVYIIYTIHFLFNLSMIIPSSAVCVRRLHDIGKSGWWYFIGLIPLVGAILLLVWMCKDSDMQTNEYGTNPKVE